MLKYIWNWITGFFTNKPPDEKLCQPLDFDFWQPPLCAGKKRAWIPDDKDAYIEVEIKQIDGVKSKLKRGMER